MFSGPSYPMAVVGILHDQTGTGYSKMAAAKQEIHIPQLVDMIALGGKALSYNRK